MSVYSDHNRGYLEDWEFEWLSKREADRDKEREEREAEVKAKAERELS